MCSFIFTNKPFKDLKPINRYTQLRGPDHTSEVHMGNLSFIHNLLSITGAFTIQPLISGDRSAFCLFNGEIYNYKDFGPYANDSLCLLPLYHQYGHAFIRRLDGEFAIVLIDLKRGELLCSTDVFATKPLWLAGDGSFFGAASYASALMRLGFRSIEKVKANTTLIFDLNSFVLKEKRPVFDFDIGHQNKLHFDDWTHAFKEAIYKRASSNVREKIFIGLSSGYDSGAIACELANQKIPFKAYSVLGAENRKILSARHDRLHDSADIEILEIGPRERSIAHAFIQENVEEFQYRTYSASSDYNEYHLRLQDDHGAGSLSHVAGCAKKDRYKIYLSGMGADELFADYGFQGQKFYPHSNFGGLFPKDLSAIFPWPSFYESSMVSYLAKEEYIAGAYGLEARYPYLDPKVVQEFLWLATGLKNRWYKSVLHNYLTANGFPFAPMQKIGF